MSIEVLFERKLVWVGALPALCAFVLSFSEFTVVTPSMSTVAASGFVALAVWAVTVLVATVLLTPVAWYLDAKRARGATREEAIAIVLRNFVLGVGWIAAFFVIRKIIGWMLVGMAQEFPIAATVVAGLLGAITVFGGAYAFYADRKQRANIPIVDISTSRDVQLK